MKLDVSGNGMDGKECSRVIINGVDVHSELTALRDQVERMREALEPSGDTKAAYMGEIRDPDTKRDVSWTAIKMIMKMISERAAKEALK